jgi:hypothetical protein
MEWSPARAQLCYLAPFVEIAGRLHVMADERTVFALSSGPDFSYCYIHEDGQVPHPVSPDDWVSIVGAQEVRYADLAACGIRSVVHPFRCAESAQAAIRSALSAGQLAVVWVDVFHLSYHPFAGERHAQGALVLLEMDWKTRTVSFIDPYIRTLRPQRVVGQLPWQALEAALLSDVLQPREIVGCAKGVLPDAATLDRLLRQNLLATASRFLRPSATARGIAGMRTLVAEMQTWGSFWQEAALARNFLMAYFHVTGRGGHVATRQVFAEALSAARLSTHALVAEGFAATAKAWSMLAATFFRGSARPAETVIRKAADQLTQIAAREQELFAIVQAIVGREAN